VRVGISQSSGGPHVTPALPDLTLPKAKSGRTVRGHDKSGTAPRRSGSNLKVGCRTNQKAPRRAGELTRRDLPGRPPRQRRTARPRVIYLKERFRTNQMGAPADEIRTSAGRDFPDRSLGDIGMSNPALSLEMTIGDLTEGPGLSGDS
jgi:hypothetical protein